MVTEIEFSPLTLTSSTDLFKLYTIAVLNNPYKTVVILSLTNKYRYLNLPKKVN